MLSKACLVGIYQRKLEYIARHGVELLVLVPPAWRDERGLTALERVYTAGYRLETLPIVFNGNFHLHFYRHLAAQMRAFSPDIVHIDEEPYNLATWQALWLARRVGARSLFFSWQNIARRYPLPFSIGERWVLRTVDYAIVGTESAAAVWRAKGYRGALRVIPQFGTDTALFRPATCDHQPRPFTIGYFGRLVVEKGVDLLLRAAAALGGEWRLHIVGDGPERAALQALAATLGVANRITWRAWLPSTAMPQQYHMLDVLVLPSRTRPNWKEQFGRVLVEAMASGVAVVGANSGAIPDVIGGAGLVFPEDDAPSLTQHLRRLREDSAYRQALARAGRKRALAHFTHEHIAAATVAVYREMLN